MFFHVHPPSQHCRKASIQQDQHLNISRPSWMARHAKPPKVSGSLGGPLQYLLRSSKSYNVLGSSSKLPVQSVFALHWFSLAASVHLIDDKVIKLLQLLTLKFIILRQVFRGGVWSQLSCTVLTSLSQDRLNIARKHLRPTRALIETTKICSQMLIQFYQPSSPLSNQKSIFRYVGLLS